MENASNALLMAAGILFGVLFISFMGFMFLMASNYTKETQDNIRMKELYEFNIQFQVYDGRSDLTAYDVQSIINLVRNYNSKLDDGSFVNEEEDPQRINLDIVENGFHIDTLLEDNRNSPSEMRFRCSLEFNAGKVSKVTIRIVP